MDWKYYIPHVWDSPDDRHVWEDVWLRPVDPAYLKEFPDKSIWLTVDANWEDIPDDIEFDEEGFEFSYCGSRAVPDMCVDVDDFNMEELLAYTRHWILREFGECGELIESPREDFHGTNADAEAIENAHKYMEEYKKREDNNEKE